MPSAQIVEFRTIRADVDRGLLLLPERLRPGLRGYLLDGHPVGGFLTALIENDLMTAAVKADPESLAALPALARFLYNDTPSSCWGSRTHREEWQALGGARKWVRRG